MMRQDGENRQTMREKCAFEICLHFNMVCYTADMFSPESQWSA